MDGDALLQILATLAFVSIAILGHLAYKHRWAWWMFTIAMWLFTLGCLGAAAFFGLVSAIGQVRPEAFANIPDIVQNMLVYLAVSLGITGLISVLLNIPKTRAFVLKPLPASPDSFLQRYALMAVLLILSVMTSFLLAVDFEYIARSLDREQNLPLSMTLMQLQLLVLTAAGVGIGITRNWSGARERLGLTPLSAKRIGYCIGGAVLVFGVTIILESFLLPYLMPENPMAKELLEALKLDMPVPAAITIFLALSLLIGAGEELFFRGLLQPALGMVVTSLFFTVVHVQYGFSPIMLVIFSLSLLFGWIRNRYGTTSAILVHAFYDFFHFTQVQLLA